MPKITNEMIYNRLREFMPLKLKELVKVPSPLDKPGPKPIRPYLDKRCYILIKEDTSIEEIIDELDINDGKAINNATISFVRNFSGDNYLEDKGDVIGIKIHATVDLPNRNQIIQDYRRKLAEWEIHCNRYQRRQAEIFDAKTHNKKLIKHALFNYKELWIETSRDFKTGSDKKYRNKLRAKLMKELEELDRLDELDNRDD